MDTGCKVIAEVLPSIAVSRILSFLSWKDKLVVVDTIPEWHLDLCTQQAWPLVIYDERATGIQSRLSLSSCMKEYGKYMVSIELGFSFTHASGSPGRQLYNDIACNCTSLRKLKIENAGFGRRSQEALLKLLSVCTRLNDISLHKPIMIWEEGNLISSLKEQNHACKVSELVLTSDSLIEIEEPLDVLEDFINLRILKIRRQELSAAVLLALSQHKLCQLSLYQNEELIHGEKIMYCEKTWEKVEAYQQNFSVNLRLENIILLKSEFLPCALLHAIILTDLAISLTKGMLDTIAEFYKSSLEIFVCAHTPYSMTMETLDRRLPISLIDLSYKCSKLKSLVYGYSMSSTAILLIAKARKLSHLVIMQDEMSYEMIHSAQNIVGQQNVQWLKEKGSSQLSLEEAVSKLLGYTWTLSSELDWRESIAYFSSI